MATKKSNLILNAETEPVVLNDGALEGGVSRNKTGTVELLTGELVPGQTVELLDLPPNAVVRKITLYNDDLDSDGTPTLTADVGLYTVDENDLVVVADIDAYASAITTLQAVNTAGVEVQFEARDIDKIEKRVFEDAGLSAVPEDGLLRLVLTILAGAATAAAGTLSFNVQYTVEA